MQNMDHPLVSIITITFNAEKELPVTMDSVSGQSFSNYEHIIIDGASTDHTLDIINDRRTPRTRLLSEPDRGLYDAMNKGLRMARGEYLLFLNAGDAFSDTDTLEAFTGFAGKDVDIIYGDTDIVNSKREVIGKRHLSAPQSLTFQSFSKGMLVCHQAFMVRRQIAPLMTFNTVSPQTMTGQ